MSSLIQQPHDKFWDEKPTRREMQAAFNKLGKNDAELTGMADTAALVLNFLCEKLGVTKAEIDQYVEKKKVEVEIMRERMRQENPEVKEG